MFDTVRELEKIQRMKLSVKNELYWSDVATLDRVSDWSDTFSTLSSHVGSLERGRKSKNKKLRLETMKDHFLFHFSCILFFCVYINHTIFLVQKIKQ